MNVSLMKKPTTNKFFILLIYLLIQACSASNEEKGVVSSEDLTIQTTITTETSVQDSPEIEELTEEEAIKHDQIFYHEVLATLEDKTLGTGASKHWDIMRKHLDWFRKNNAKAYMVLLD